MPKNLNHIQFNFKIYIAKKNLNHIQFKFEKNKSPQLLLIYNKNDIDYCKKYIKYKMEYVELCNKNSLVSKYILSRDGKNRLIII